MNEEQQRQATEDAHRQWDNLTEEQQAQIIQEAEEQL